MCKIIKPNSYGVGALKRGRYHG